MIWNIHILTIPSRTGILPALLAEFDRQIKQAGLVDIVKVRTYGGEGFEGFKRNQAIDDCDAFYSSFMDDDDFPTKHYVPGMYELMKDCNVDCIGIKGIVDFRGHVQKPMIQSIRYDKYFEEGGTYFRPPTHLNPIKTEIFRNYRFQNIGAGCDKKQAENMVINKAIKSEAFFEEPVYIYNYDSTKIYGVT